MQTNSIIEMQGAMPVGSGDLLDLIVVMFIMQLVMAAWLYDLTRKVCKKDTQSKAPSEQL
jgi:hypothetical protein